MKLVRLLLPCLWLSPEVKFLRGRDDSVTGLSLGGGRIEGIDFVRQQ
jgi:hypothetical protein